MKLLNISASPRGEQSRTLKISDFFISQLKKKYENLIIEDLDLFKEDLPEVLNSAAEAKYNQISGKPQNSETKQAWDKVTAYSNSFLSADIYVIAAPMWNFSIPYKLKHYIDVIMQPGFLFRFSENGVEGLAKNKKMFCITTRGNDYGPNTPMHSFDFMEPYLRSIFGLAGIYDITFLNAQPLDIAPATTEVVMQKSINDANLMAINSLESFAPVS